MNLFDDVSKEEVAKRIKEKQRGMGQGIQRKKRKAQIIPRHGIISNEYSRRIYPLDFALPFNPFDLNDDTYDSEYRYIFTGLGSATQAFQYFKVLLAEDRNLMEQTCKTFGVDSSFFNLTGDRAITQAEFEKFKKCRIPRSYSEPVFSTQFSDRKDTRFPVLYRARCVMDENGRVLENEETGLFWTLHLIESECIARQVALVRKTFENGGENAHLSNKQQKRILEEVWKSRLISKPFYKYAVRYIHLVCDEHTYALDKYCEKAWDKGRINQVEAIKLAGYDFMETLCSYIGHRKDNHFDFLEIEYKNPYIPLIDSHKKGQYTSKIQASIVDRADSLVNTIDDFEQVIRNYLNEPKYWDESVIEGSIREFATISDEVLASKFMNDLHRYKNVLDDPTILVMLAQSNIAGTHIGPLDVDKEKDVVLAQEVQKVQRLIKEQELTGDAQKVCCITVNKLLECEVEGKTPTRGADELIADKYADKGCNGAATETPAASLAGKNGRQS